MAAKKKAKKRVPVGQSVDAPLAETSQSGAEAPGNRKKTGNRPTAFKAGQSGNPSGRPKKTEAQREVEEMAKEHTAAALAALVHVAAQSVDLKAKQSAAVALLDRAWGRSVERVQSESTSTVTHVDRGVRAAEEILADAPREGTEGDDKVARKKRSVLPAAVRPTPTRH